jgi:hypothetical protein
MSTRGEKHTMPTDPSIKKNNHWNLLTWSLIAACSILGWISIGQRSVSRLILIATLSLASFMVGCLVAFLFTSYGEESATVGKIRDWLIGGLTGVTIVEFSRIKALLLTFAVGPGSAEFALVAGVSDNILSSWLFLHVFPT